MEKCFWVASRRGGSSSVSFMLILSLGAHFGVQENTWLEVLPVNDRVFYRCEASIDKVKQSSLLAAEYPVASFFSCSSFIDWLDAPWPHYTALESIGHRNETGEGHYQCRSHRAHSQRSGSIFLWLHCEVASVPYYKQVKYQSTEGKKGRSFCMGLKHVSTQQNTGKPVSLKWRYKLLTSGECFGVVEPCFLHS